MEWNYLFRKKRLQDVVESVNKSIDDTIEIDAIDTRFIQNSAENLEAISKVVDIKISLDLKIIENLVAKYPSFITINKFKKNLRNKLTIASMTKDYDKLLGRDDTEKVLVDVTNYFVSMKPIRTLQTIKVKASVA